MRRDAAPARMREALAIEKYRAEFVLQRANRLLHRRTFTEAQKAGNVGEFRRSRCVCNFDDAMCFAVINDGGGEDGLFVAGERAIGPGDKSRQRFQRRDHHPFAQARLFDLPFFDERRPIGIGFSAKRHASVFLRRRAQYAILVRPRINPARRVVVAKFARRFAPLRYGSTFAAPEKIARPISRNCISTPSSNCSNSTRGNASTDPLRNEPSLFR